MFNVDGTSSTHTSILTEDAPDYDQIKKELDPIFGNLAWEHVTVIADGERRDMFVDDTGLLMGLSLNVEATLIYQTNTLGFKPAAPAEGLSPIVGTAILYNTRMWF